MKKYLREKVLQTIYLAKIRESTRIDIRLQNDTFGLLVIEEKKPFVKYLNKVLYLHEKALWTYDRNNVAFEEKSPSKYILYVLNDIFYNTLKKNQFSSLEIGEVVDHLLKANYAMVATGKFLVSDFDDEKRLYDVFRKNDDLSDWQLHMDLLSFSENLEMNKDKAKAVETYFKKATERKELYQKYYKTLFSLTKSNDFYQKNIEDKLRILLNLVQVDERFTIDYLNYLKYSSQRKQPALNPLMKQEKKEQQPVLSRNELRRQLAKYYDVTNNEISNAFDYENFDEVLVLLKDLNMIEERNDKVFNALSTHAIINDAYLDYLYKKVQFQLPNDENLQSINEYFEELKTCNAVDAIFWKEQIRETLLGLKGKLQNNFKYENEELKRCKKL